MRHELDSQAMWPLAQGVDSGRSEVDSTQGKEEAMAQQMELSARHRPEATRALPEIQSGPQ